MLVLCKLVRFELDGTSLYLTSRFLANFTPSKYLENPMDLFRVIELLNKAHVDDQK